LSFSPVHYVKAHPIQAASVGVVSVLALYLVLHHSASNSAAPAAGATDPALLGAEVQAAAQQAQIQAQANGQAAQINGQIQLAQIAGANQLALAQLSAQTATQEQVNQYTAQTTHDQLAYQLGVLNSNNNTAVQTDTINTQGAIAAAGIAANVEQQKLLTQASVDMNAANNQTQQFVVGQTAQTQQVLAAISGQTQQIISGNQTQVAITQANDQAGASKHNSDDSMWGGIAMAALAFL
jgi:hypothetical protein